MLKRTLIVLTITLLQVGCDAEWGENIYPFQAADLSDGARATLERRKRDLLKIEDLKIGIGPVAAWGRRISADVEVRYADGTIVYKGPITTYQGFHVAL